MADDFNPLPRDPDREMAYRAGTAANLYSSHLSAVVVLVGRYELGVPSAEREEEYLGMVREDEYAGMMNGTHVRGNYKTGKGSNQGWCH